MKIYIIMVVAALLTVSCTKKGEDQSQAEGEQAWQASNDMEELGYHLYFEKRFSKDDSISCNTCHDIVNRGNGAQDTPVATGINGLKGGRNSPTVWNAKFLSVQFWDGRAKDLAEQAKGPITNPVEMGMENHDMAIAKIKEDEKYKKLFKKAFPGDADPINIENTVTAIAAFEETLTTVNSPFDKKEMSELAQKGYQEFQTVGCVACHSGDHFAGPSLPIGTGFYMKFPTVPNEELENKYGFSKDLGRLEATKKEADKHMWRVPTLRNVARTAPYFHTGSVSDLKEAIRVMGKLQLNKDLTDEQVTAIEAFLTALNGELPLIKDPNSN